jgi:hypothetical protein
VFILQTTTGQGSGLVLERQDAMVFELRDALIGRLDYYSSPPAGTPSRRAGGVARATPAILVRRLGPWLELMHHPAPTPLYSVK